MISSIIRALITCLFLMSIQTVNATNPDTIWTKKVHPDGNGCNSVSFSKNGTHLLAVTDCHFAVAKLFTASTGIEQWSYTDSSLMCFMDVKFSPNGEKFAVMEEFGIVIIFDYTVFPPKKIAQINTGSNASLALTFSRDNRFVITSGFDDSVRVFDLYTNIQTKVFGSHNNIFTLTNDYSDKIIATGSQTGSIRIWDSLGNMVRHINVFPSNVPVRSIAFTPDGGRLFCLGQNGQFKSFMTNTWESDTGYLVHHTSAYGLSIAPLSGCFVTSAGKGKLNLWNLNNYSLINTLELPELGIIKAVDIDVHEQKIAAGGSSGLVAVFNLQHLLTEDKRLNVQENHIKVFPNPLSSILHIEVNHPVPLNLIITNYIGKIIWQGKITTREALST